MIDEDEYGGDPPCWAHLFADETCAAADAADAPPLAAAPRADAGEVIDLGALARAAGTAGAVWTHQSEDLNVNLLVFPAGEGVATHVNTDVDVLLVGVAGEGVVEIEGTRRLLRAGQALVIPKGASRATQSSSGLFAYLSCHRRRAGLWPKV